MASTTAATEIGTLAEAAPSIPGFELIRPLGRGGMGMVYLARQTGGLNREVAVKTILAERTGPYFRRKFLQEGQRQAELHHRHILPIFVAGEADDCLFLAMHYARNGSLRDRMNAGPIPVEECVSFVCSVLEALQHAHNDLDKPLAHLDVKPENILFDGDNLYLSDFGIARKLEEELGPATAVAGDPRYWAPEQQANAATTQSDLFALGIMFFELLTGERPPHHLRVITEHSGTERLRKKLPANARRYAPLIARCLREDPQQRPTAIQMLAELSSPSKKSPHVVLVLAVCGILVGLTSVAVQPTHRDFVTTQWHRLFPQPQYAVNFILSPVEAELWVDDEERTFRTLTLTAGEHTVAIVADGYIGQAKVLDIAEDNLELTVNLSPLPTPEDREYLAFFRSFGVDQTAANTDWGEPTLANIAALDRLEHTDRDQFQAHVRQLTTLATAGDVVASTSLFYAAFEGISVPGSTDVYMPRLIDASNSGYAIASLLRALYVLTDLLKAEETFDNNPHAHARVEQLLTRVAAQGMPEMAALAAATSGVTLAQTN